MITLKNYLTANGKYPERENHPELTEEVIKNANNLLDKVNKFLTELGIKDAKVSSGFRPSSVNSSIPNAAKRSLHMSCQAIDLVDPKGELDDLVSKNDALKKKYGLWQESSKATPTWLHLDIKDRGVRKDNTFIP